VSHFYIEKVFNNNVVLARDETGGEEAVLVGKGLGFNVKWGNIISSERAEKIFFFMEKNKFKELSKFNEGIVGITEEIITMVSKELKDPLNEHIHVALADHIGFTLGRLKAGFEINNPFLEEIKALYTKEYELACNAVTLIQEKMEVDIPEGETGFIAMHIHSARINSDISKTVKSTFMINKMVDIIEKELQIKLDRHDSHYTRLVIHLRFALNRIENGVPIKNPLLSSIKRKFNRSYEVSKSIGEYIGDRIGVIPPEDELGHLAIHIQRILDSITEKTINNDL